MKEAIKIVEQEISWHQQNKGECTKGNNYAEGFNKALEHIRDLLVQADQIGEEEN